MAKSKEELDALKSKLETINAELQDLSEEELKYVSGGTSGVMGSPDPDLWLDIKKPDNVDPLWAEWQPLPNPRKDDPEPVYIKKR